MFPILAMENFHKYAHNLAQFELILQYQFANFILTISRMTRLNYRYQFTPQLYVYSLFICFIKIQNDEIGKPDKVSSIFY